MLLFFIHSSILYAEVGDKGPPANPLSNLPSNSPPNKEEQKNVHPHHRHNGPPPGNMSKGEHKNKEPGQNKAEGPRAAGGSSNSSPAVTPDFGIGSYEITMSKKAPDVYAYAGIQDVMLYIVTKQCANQTLNDSVTMRIDKATDRYGEIIFSNGEKCELVGIFK